MNTGKLRPSTSAMKAYRSPLPSPADFDSWTSHDWSNGVEIDDLAPYDRVTVRTRNSTYEMIVTCPETAEVLVRGGAFFRDFTRAHVAGSSLGGSFLKLRGVYAGFQLELVSNRIPVITTAVRTVIVASAGHERIM
jgi:hypothetical protein